MLFPLTVEPERQSKKTQDIFVALRVFKHNGRIGSPAGLPDFSWYVVPKQEKCTKSTQDVPKGHKIHQISLKYFQMAIKCINIFKSKAPQNLPKLELATLIPRVSAGRMDLSPLTVELGDV
jgi:hypothetical protein